MTADLLPKTICTATGTITNGPAEEQERIGGTRILAVYRSAGSVAMPRRFLVSPVGPRRVWSSYQTRPARYDAGV